MNYNNDYMTKSYYVEQDDFFKYVREYLQEESSHMYYKQYIDDNDSDVFSDEEDGYYYDDYEFY